MKVRQPKKSPTSLNYNIQAMGSRGCDLNLEKLAQPKPKLDPLALILGHLQIAAMGVIWWSHPQQALTQTRTRTHLLCTRYLLLRSLLPQTFDNLAILIVRTWPIHLVTPTNDHYKASFFNALFISSNMVFLQLTWWLDFVDGCRLQLTIMLMEN